MSERGVTIVKGVVRFGDYSNGRFCERAGYDISRVEHDAEGVSIILDVPEGDNVFGHHVHLNISADVLRRLARDYELARSEGNYYPGRQAGSTAVPEETPREKAWEQAGYASVAPHPYLIAHDFALSVGPFDKEYWNRGQARYRAEHPEARP